MSVRDFSDRIWMVLFGIFGCLYCAIGVYWIGALWFLVFGLRVLNTFLREKHPKEKLGQRGNFLHAYFGRQKMPLDFPDLDRLRKHFDHHSAVPYTEGESEAGYRDRCAKWSEEKGDLVQAHEVRIGKGWNRWNDVQTTEVLKKEVGPGTMFNLLNGTDIEEPGK